MLNGKKDFFGTFGWSRLGLLSTFDLKVVSSLLFGVLLRGHPNDDKNCCSNSKLDAQYEINFTNKQHWTYVHLIERYTYDCMNNQKDCVCFTVCATHF